MRPSIPVFKIRASAAGQIMGGAIGKPTPLQLKLLADLEAKKAIKPLTDRQQATLDELIAKRDAPPTLQKGAKTYCQNWLKEILYGRREPFVGNKYTEHGIKGEQQGIELTCRVMGYEGVIKNEKYFENDWFTGTYDIKTKPKRIEDIKCSWSAFTFPLFDSDLPESDYFFQGQIYMDLDNADEFSVNYCLVDAPAEIIEKEAYFASKRKGFDELDYLTELETMRDMTYGAIPEGLEIAAREAIPDKLRFKSFEFKYDESVIAALKTQVELCREYINELINQLYPEQSTIIAHSPEPNLIIVEKAKI